MTPSRPGRGPGLSSRSAATPASRPTDSRTGQTLRTIVPYLRPYRKSLYFGVAVLLLRNLTAAGIPLLIGLAVDSLTSAFSFATAFRFAGGLIVLTGVKGLFQYWMRVTLITISRDVEYDLRNDLFGHLIRLSSDFYSRFRTGDIMARATNDLNAVRMMLGPGIMYSADTVATAGLAVTVMAFVDWPLTLAALAPAPLVSVLVALFGRFIHRQFGRIQESFSSISSRAQENLTGVRVVRAYVQEKAEEQRFDELSRQYAAENVRLARVAGMFHPALQSLTGLSFLIVLWFGGYRLLAGQITLGDFLMFNVYLGTLIWPMIAMGWVVNLLQRGTASLARIRDLMDERPSIAEPAAPAPLAEPARGELVFDDVSLQVDGRQVLDGVSLRIPAGATVAIVGHTGSGKSSLVQLIPRIMDPTGGRILLDGVDLRELPLAGLRRLVGFVPQETFLFSTTLAENIAFGVDSATEEQIRRAAEMAGLAGDIEGFPDGYQTMIGERGITLSGGQKQRAAIARAVIRDPRILILDDALSSVDAVTEERILTALAGVMRNRTTILISHRVSTVRNAGRIFVIENGRVAEEGSHDELVSPQVALGAGQAAAAGRRAPCRCCPPPPSDTIWPKGVPMSADNDNSSKFIWFLAGAAIGATVALLYAPQSGAETRRRISQKTGEGREALAESSREILDRGRELFDKGRQIADEAAEMFDRGRKLVQG